MYLLVPASSKQALERASWFKKPVARQLAQEKGVEFGFELKGEPETIRQAPPLYWGYHLPGEFAAEWHYHPELHDKLLKSISHLTSLNPSYINLHGPKLWWQPKAKEYVRRYFNRSEPKEYFQLLEMTVELIKILRKTFPNLTFENTCLCDYYRHDARLLPETSYQTNIGILNDLFYLQKQTGVELLFDLEHFILNQNFLARLKNYRHLPKNINKNESAQEKKLCQIFGFYIQKGSIPYLSNPVNLEDFVKILHAKYYHLTGSTQDVIPGKKDLTHGPVKKDDKIFRKNLRLVLAQKPEMVLLETASRGDNACYNYLRSNETELSFYTLCEILLEEL